MRTFFISISLLLAMLAGTTAMAQEQQPSMAVSFPDSIGSRLRYTALIELPRGYISGICILFHAEKSEVRGAIFNEFGLSALDFVYDIEKEKVTLGEVIKLMDRWRIRRVLKRDLAQLMKNLSQGVGSYQNEKNKIHYRLTQLNDATEE